jgi:von Willebrand factor type A domain
MRRRVLTVGWLCAAVILAIGACSGDDDGDDTGKSSDGKSSDPRFGNADSTIGDKPSGKAGNNSSGGGGAGVDIDDCATGIARTSRITPRVVLVLDGSCSMSTNYPANGERSATMCTQNPNGRWAAVRNALIGQNGVVTRLDGVVEFGLAVFGTSPQCPIPATPIDPGLNNLQPIQAALPDVQPGMFTPTGLALDWVYDNMFSTADVDAEPGPQILILATDGEPNSCDSADTNYQPSIDALNKGNMLGVTTYVISLADAAGEFHDHLQTLANIGANTDQATLYTPATPDDLEADLELLVGGAVGCDVALNGQVDTDHTCEGVVTLNGNPVPCNDKDGWILPDARHIRLQGKACDTLKASKTAELDADFPCGIFMVD